MNPTVIVATVAALALPALLVLAALLGPRRRRARLARLTATGSATVLAMTATHLRVGNQPVVKFRLRLRFGDGGRTEDVDLKIAIHPLDDERVQLGSVFPLRFEPGQPANFSIDLGGDTGIELSAL